MQPVTRFAPSPTGRLHLGHAYSALRAHDLARSAGGTFLLRIEDIDPGRTRADHVGGIIEDLLWLGLSWDGEIVYQSERLDAYQAALDRLEAMDLLYPCFCTRAEIRAETADSLAAPHAPAALYPGTCRTLGDAERAAKQADRAFAWRLDTAAAWARAGPLKWLEKGQAVEARPDRLGDVILARKDAPASYHLAVTLDDAEQQVSHVVRGVDLFESTHIHRLLQALLGLPTPAYLHHPLLADAQGQRLAKRHGAPTLASLRAAGTDPEELVEGLRTGDVPGGYSLAQD